MSWLARSLANSIRLDDDEDEHENDVTPHTPHQHHHSQSSNPNYETHQHHHSQSSTPNYETHQHQQQYQKGEIQSLSSLALEEESHSRGVKEDLTELKQTLTRQLWGVASFLAPPPPPPPPPPDSCHQSNDRSDSNSNQSEPSGRSVSEDEGEPSDSAADSGIRSDFAEIGGRFRSGVTEISKMASNYFPFGSEENVQENLEENEEFKEQEEKEFGEGAVGITDEVLVFARNIAMHPETWLDFPHDEEEDLDDFDMSNAQREHSLAIEHLDPRLAALRIELCPCHMSESYFWKVYFVLLHSRLNKHDAEILSTSQVMEARALWMQELQKQTKETDWFGRSISSIKDNNDVLKEELIPSSFNYAPPEYLSPRIYAFEPPSIMTTDYEIVKHPVESTEIQFIDKAIIEEKPVLKTEDKDLMVGPSSKIQVPNYEDDDDWPEEEDSDFGGYNRAPICVGNEEDVSFSDLEDDDVGSVPIKSIR